MKTLRAFSRILVGVVFIFSGFVKAVDPLGSTYKFTDYFNAFGMEFMVWSALPLAFILSAVELVMGISLLLGYRMKTVSWAVLLFMSFFTVLTFVLAIFNPVTDCGCFGDALILTNWQTFWKNIVLMVFTLLIFTGRNTFLSIRNAIAEWGILAFFFVAILGLSIYCKNHLPILDFMPYKTGTNIIKASSVPEGAPIDVYETRLFYKNSGDGKTSEFTIDNFPKDTLWKFVDSKSVLISEGYKPPIHDFSIAAPNGGDLSETIKNSKGFVYLLVSYNLSKANLNGLKKANDYFKLSGIFKDVSFYAVTASVEKDIRSFRDSLGLSYDFGSADEIALKTMVRSNPGLLLIKDGTIIGKWHYNDFPVLSDIEKGFAKQLSDYPLSVGVDLRNLKAIPDGARSDVYKTSLLYRNTLNDSIGIFTMDNFPQSSDWVFVSSNSEKVKSGYLSPLEDFKLLTPEGSDITEKILQQSGDLFLITSNAPHNLDPDILERLNKLSMAAASLPQGPVFFYGMTGLTSQQLYGFTDSFITAISFCSGNPDFIQSVSGKGVSLFHIKDGKVLGRWDNNSIPGPEELQRNFGQTKIPGDFESFIMPYLFEKSRNSIEEKRVYVLILGFLFLALFIRVFFEDPFVKR
jgi:uncharacterized membrane protein YphA (DoxX/SURF4 family)